MNISFAQLLKEAVENAMVMEKLELVDWNVYTKMVADAYEAAPDNEPRAQAAFQSMKQTVLKHFNMIQSKARVEFVDEDPYKTAEEMREAVKREKVLKIAKNNSDHPFFSPEENWKFRAVHDWFTHVISGQPFTHRGELQAYNVHTKMFPPAAWPALFTEIIGQVCYDTVHGKFPTQKVCILDGFDYKNIGRVENHDIVNKKLVPRTSNSVEQVARQV